MERVKHLQDQKALAETVETPKILTLTLLRTTGKRKEAGRSSSLQKFRKPWQELLKKQKAPFLNHKIAKINSVWM
jgi:hypothetical protein